MRAAALSGDNSNGKPAGSLAAAIAAAAAAADQVKRQAAAPSLLSSDSEDDREIEASLGAAIAAAAAAARAARASSAAQAAADVAAVELRAAAERASSAAAAAAVSAAAAAALAAAGGAPGAAATATPAAGAAVAAAAAARRGALAGDGASPSSPEGEGPDSGGPRRGLEKVAAAAAAAAARGAAEDEGRTPLGRRAADRNGGSGGGGGGNGGSADSSAVEEADDDALRLYPPSERSQIRESWDALMRWSKALRRANGGASAPRAGARPDPSSPEPIAAARKVVVFGGGSFGTAMGCALARKKPTLDVVLLLRDAALCESVNRHHLNRRYLPGLPLPTNVRATTDAAEALSGAAYAVHAVPVQHSRAFLRTIRDMLPPDVPIVCVSKGLEAGTGLMMSEVVQQALGAGEPMLRGAAASVAAAAAAVPAAAMAGAAAAAGGVGKGGRVAAPSTPAPSNSSTATATGPATAAAATPPAADAVLLLRPPQPAVFLSGPSFAREVMQGRPTAVVAASNDPALAREVGALFACPALRVNTSTDVLGVEICGALKNVLAIAAGIVEGLELGHNASAALVAQGCAEIRWLAERMGAQPSTVSGLSGLGDIMLTCYGDLSRNRTVGLRLGRGEALQDILASSSQVAEGVATAGTVAALARRYRVSLPVLTAVAQVLAGNLDAAEAVAEIMRLPQIEEH